MATLTKSRARAPLAESKVSHSWASGSFAPGELLPDGDYRLHVSSETHNFALHLDRKETLSFAAWFAGRETWKPAISWAQDTRSVPEKLRALADSLEGAGERSSREQAFMLGYEAAAGNEYNIANAKAAFAALQAKGS